MNRTGKKPVLVRCPIHGEDNIEQVVQFFKPFKVFWKKQSAFTYLKTNTEKNCRSKRKWYNKKYLCGA